MGSKSIWQDESVEINSYPSLEKDTRTELVIIGAGITGLTTALSLIKRGKKVCIIESTKISQGTTGFSTGNLYVPVEPYYYNLISKFGENTARMIATSRVKAIDFVEDTISELAIDCSFIRRPFYFYTKKPEHVSVVEKEASAFKSFGLNVQLTDITDLPYKVEKALKLDSQARFNPSKYIRALAKYLVTAGCEIYEDTSCLKIFEKNGECVAITKTGTVTASKAVIATHMPIGINKIQFSAYPYRSYAVAFRTRSGFFPKGHYRDIDENLSISSHNIHSKGMDTLIVSGSKHKTGQPLKSDHNLNFSLINEFIANNFEIENISHHWSAQHYQPADDIPYIGPASLTSKNIFMATGYHADGLTYGTVAGLLLADLTLGISNELSAIYSPNRFTPLASVKKYIKENVNVLKQYIAGLVFSTEAKAIGSINPGEGKIIKFKGQKCGVYRDINNEVHIVSAVCTHMSCIVKWNNAERTWDCPCHGSRFETNGEVIEGPAVIPLRKHTFT